jgi:hypothetical protein
MICSCSVTEAGLEILARSNIGVGFGPDKFRAEQKRVFHQLWRKAYRLQKEILTKMPVRIMNEKGEITVSSETEE